MFFLDTNFCIAFLRGRGGARRLLPDLALASIAVPAIVRAELLYGARKSGRVEVELEKAVSFLEPYASIPFDDAAAETYASIRADLEAQGRVIGDHDMLIAATALSRQATLITRNVAEFQRVPGLRLLSWED